MKHISFVVTLGFNDEIESESEIKEIAENISSALQHEIEHGEGLASVVSETFTRSIVVSHSGVILTNWDL
jgi:hypothetical protein